MSPCSCERRTNQLANLGARLIDNEHLKAAGQQAVRHVLLQNRVWQADF
jgi:hypothetical protein